MFRVKLLNEHGRVLARTLRIRHARGSLETPTYAVSVAEIDQRLIRGDDLQGVVEVPVSFRPERLKVMGRNNSLQQQFEYRMNSWMKRIPPDQFVVGVPLLEGRLDLSLSVDDSITCGAYVAELISNPRIDVVCTPIFHRIAEPLIKVIVKEFLRAVTSYDVYVALSVPYASRETREELIEMYFRFMNENNRVLPNFLCVDYNGSNPISKYTLHNYVLRYVRALQEEIDGPVAIYGVNVKYSRVARKYDELPARDLAAYFAQTDVFGENHKRRNLPREVAEKMKVAEDLGKQKLLNRRRYTYVSISKMLENPVVAVPEARVIENLAERVQNVSYVESIVKRVNVRNILNEAGILKQLFSGKGWEDFDDPLKYLKSKEITRIDNILLQRLESFAKLYRPPKSRKLDDYA